MKTVFTSRKMQLLGVAASATLLSLLSGIYPATAQSTITAPTAQSSGRRAIAQSPLQLQKTTPQKRAAMSRASGRFNSRTQVLAPVIGQKHPIDASVALAQHLDLSGPTVPLKGHIPGLVANARKVSALAEDQPMTITFDLKPRDQAGMDDLAKRLYDPEDPQFHHFLTPEQRIARFSPTQEDFNKVVAYAQQIGLRVVDSATDRQMIKAAGTVKQVQNALQIHLNNYQLANGKSFYAPDQEPSVPQAVAPLLMGIEQLSNADQPRPTYLSPSQLGPKQQASRSQKTLDGSGPGGNGSGGSGSGGSGLPQPLDILEWDGIGIPAAEIQYCYDLDVYLGNTPLNGAGQRIALLEYGDFYASDIQGYINYNANSNTFPITLNAIPLQYHFIAGEDPGYNGNTTECELDIEMVEAVADGLSQLDVYEVADGTLTTGLRQILADNTDKQVSISYEFDENSGTSFTESIVGGLTEEMAIQGQAVFVSSGDYGAYGIAGTSLTVNYAAATPWVTGVGGTTLSLLGGANYGQWGWEYGWNSYDGVHATGGGISQYFGIPTYQIDYFGTNNVAGDVSYSNRNVPDVAWDADPTTGVYAYIQGNSVLLGGTSCGAPIWAAFWAQLNQTRAIFGQSNMGFANPVLYSDANNGRYSTDFHDAWPGSNNYYYSSYNYDDTTGLGSMNGLNLLNGLLFSGAYAPAGELVGGIGPYGTLSGYPGQSLYLDIYMNAPVPPYCTAFVDFYQVVNGSNVQISTSYLTAGEGYANFATTAPDVKTPTNEQYIAGVTYYDSNTGKYIGSEQYTNTLTLTVNPITLSSLSLSPTAVQGAQAVTGTINLNTPADHNEVIDLTSSDPAHAPVPATVTVPSGSQSVNFTINAVPIGTAEQVNITATPDSGSTLGGGSVSGQLTLNATPQSITSMVLKPTSVTGGVASKGTLTMIVPAASNLLIQLTSSNTSVTVPKSVTVPAGKTTATFNLGTKPVAANTTATVTAAYGNDMVMANLTVLAPTVHGFAITPATVVGPATATGKFTLTGKTAAGGITYGLSSSNPAVASVPSSVTVAAGQNTASFAVSASAVKKATTVTITLTDPISGSAFKKTLTVKP